MSQSRNPERPTRPAEPSGDEALFEPVDAVRTSERVARAIRRTIVEGRFRPGEALPPERTLARRFKVTRNTVREALRTLEQARLVSIRQGSGVLVLDYLTHAGLEFLAALLDAGTREQNDLLEDIHEARAVLGEAMCQNALHRVDGHGLPAIEGAVAALEHEAGKPRPDVRTLQQLDFQVQNRLIRAGGNRAFILLHNSLGHVYGRIAHLFEYLVADPKGLAARYRKAANRLRRGDVSGARKALSAVFEAGRAKPTRTAQRSGRKRP